jgi:ribonuclease HII
MIENLILFDKKFHEQYNFIAGVDEVGRGPLAGPVVAAAVILPKKYTFRFLNDSKKLSRKERLIAEAEIKEQALAYSIIEQSIDDIETYNILGASKRAMVLAIKALKHPIDFVLIDGNQRLEIDLKQETIIKGDSLSASIAAASILAKVYRDNLMDNFAKIYPQYGFEKHKGYASFYHRAKIKEFGPCPIHRPSFLRKINAEMAQLNFLEE